MNLESEIANFKIFLESKMYPNSLIEWAIRFYPIMCDYFGYENTIKFFNEYTLIPRERIGSNSGATRLDIKTIEFDWQMKNFHEALTIFIHEAAHAIGSLEINFDHMLMEGQKDRESFFAKLEEAFVSDKQNEMEYGELNYDYMTINTFTVFDEFHKNDFKTQPTQKYSVNSVIYRNLLLLLGENSDLFSKNMFSKNIEDKVFCFEKAVAFLEGQLTKDELQVLKDCVCTFTINTTYRGKIATIYDFLQDNSEGLNEHDKEEYLKELKENLKSYYPKNYSYAVERNLLNKSVFSAIDDLCSLTIDVLKRRLSSMDYNSFEAIKEASQYFVKIDNNSEELIKKREDLKELLLEKINSEFPSLLNISFDDPKLSNSKFELLTQIISLSSFSEDDVDKISIVYENDTILVNLGNYDYSVQTEPIYSESFNMFSADNEIVGYKVMLSGTNNVDFNNMVASGKRK